MYKAIILHYKICERLNQSISSENLLGCACETRPVSQLC